MPPRTKKSGKQIANDTKSGAERAFRYIGENPDMTMYGLEFRRGGIDKRAATEDPFILSKLAGNMFFEEITNG